MNPALVLKCSPHAGGVSDTLAECFAAGLDDADFPASCIALREHPVFPCTGCGACARSPHTCVLAPKDDAEWLFARFAEAPLVVLASPIFFYALPAGFKAWIDRGQRFWAAFADRAASDTVLASSPDKPVLALLAAGRPHGEELFSGALRTLRWFLPLLGGRLVDSRCFRGLDRVEDVQGRPEDPAALREWACAWGQRLSALQAQTGTQCP